MSDFTHTAASALSHTTLWRQQSRERIQARARKSRAQVLTIKSVLGPQEIKGERGLLVGCATMNTRDRDEVSVVEDAEALLRCGVSDGRLKLPPGY